ncbi:MAG: histidine phosphatase family protein [Actinomycetota bacterium]
MSSPPATQSPMDRAFLNGVEGVTELVLVRHGQQRFPADVRSSVPEDWRDPPLSETGERQAEAVGRYLANERIDAVYASPLLRAHDTGSAIAAPHDRELNVLAELEEIHVFRDLEPGKTAAEALGQLQLSGMRERWARERRWDVYPHTEPSMEFRRRANAAVEGIIAQHPGEQVAVACHGGVINAYLAEILHLGEDMFFRPAHASVHRVLALGDRRVILSLNEVPHLPEGDLLTV